MELKQLQSFVTVVKYKSFTKAAAELFLSQPTISTHIRQLEEELHSRLIVRTTKSIELTPRGAEVYGCACKMLKLHDNLIDRFQREQNRIIRLGSSTIPSAYILPEILPDYGKLHPEVYFVIHQSDSQGVVDGLLNDSFHIGMIGMPCERNDIACLPFYEDRMVLITPVTSRFLALKKEPELPLSELLAEPIILREQGSGSKKSADYFLESMHIRESDLNIVARINDQESIKNLVAGGLGVSIISQKAAHNFALEKRVLTFELPKSLSTRNLYLIYHKNYMLPDYTKEFIAYVKQYYRT